MLTAAGIVPEEPRWVRDSHRTRSFLDIWGGRLASPGYHNVRYFAEDFVPAFQWMDEEYQRTGDEKFFIPDDVRKRALLHVMKCCEEFRHFHSPAGEPPVGYPPAEVYVEFMNRFREE